VPFRLGQPRRNGREETEGIQRMHDQPKRGGVQAREHSADGLGNTIEVIRLAALPQGVHHVKREGLAAEALKVAGPLLPHDLRVPNRRALNVKRGRG